MIRMADATTIAALSTESEALLKIRSAAALYGVERPFCRFWTGDRGGVLMVSDGVATLHAGDDGEEMAAFLSMSSDVTMVRTDAKTAMWLAEEWRGDVETGTVMRAERLLQKSGEIATLPPGKLYDLLSSVFGLAMPPFDVWYADVHYRWRHGRLHTAAIEDMGEVLSCAMTVAECEDAVLIGAVATKPKVRGRGLAGRCVRALAHGAESDGRAVWISPKNEAAASLYHHLGFSPCGRWGTVKK